MNTCIGNNIQSIQKKLIIGNQEEKKIKSSHNGRFCAMAALSRRQFCGKLHVTPPQQVQWKPPLRKAARAVIRQRGIVQCEQENKK
jgi:hypothetical protein